MTRIRVEAQGGDVYCVRVVFEGRSSEYEVSASAAALRRYGGDAAAERLIEASFVFLLEREPPESILGRFELSVIERYFPDYPVQIRKRLE